MSRARFVGLGLQRELEAVAAVDAVFAEIVDGVAQSANGFIRAAAGIGLRAFASAPQDKNLRAQFRAQIHRAHGFLQGISAHFRIVGGKGAIAENRMKEERHGRHGHDDATVLCRLS